MQIEKPQTVWKVVETEFERGWGQKHWGEVYFTTEKEADDHIARLFTEYQDSEWFVRGTKVKM
jgi:hypothetical protein